MVLLPSLAAANKSGRSDVERARNTKRRLDRNVTFLIECVTSTIFFRARDRRQCKLELACSHLVLRLYGRAKSVGMSVNGCKLRLPVMQVEQ